jgi:hypothetical protein
MSIVVCPRCQALLALPAEALSATDLECPECCSSFARASAETRPLSLARVAALVAPATPGLPPWTLPDPVASGVHVYEPSLELATESTADAPAASLPKRTQEVAIEPEDLPGQASRSAADDDFAIGDEEGIDAEDESINFAPTSETAFELHPGKRGRRRPSGVAGLAGIVGGGLGGLLLGGYVLLWLRGDTVDFFHMARWMPQALLPPSMQMASEDAGDQSAADPAQRVDDASASIELAKTDAPADAESSNGGDAPATDAPDVVHVDPEVAPAAATEPAADGGAVDAQPASPPRREVQWPVTPIVADLKDARLFSLAELTAATSVARDAAARFIAGDLSNPESVRDMGRAYVELCALAEAFTLTDPIAYSSEMFTQLALAKEALRSAAAPACRADLAVIAGRWLTHESRKNAGTLLVGTVRDLRMQGRWTECDVEIAFGDESISIPVLMDRLEYRIGREVAVAGVIVAEPQRRIAGYQGDAPQVVIAGYKFDPSTVVDWKGTSPEPDFELQSE